MLFLDYCYLQLFTFLLFIMIFFSRGFDQIQKKRKMQKKCLIRNDQITEFKYNSLTQYIEPFKNNVVKICRPMTQPHYDFDIFHEQQSESFCQKDDYFFDVDFFYKEESTEDNKDEPPQLMRIFTDQFAEEPHVEPFRPYPLPASPDMEPLDEPNLFRSETNHFHEEQGTFFREEISTPSPINESQENKKVQAKSIATKNVCFNICQKTIKMIQKKFYGKKLTDICEYFGADEEEFTNHIVSQKKHFTGPKALSMYVDSETVFAKVFREFMRWFLKEKYLRHCLNGDMKDKESYIKYKNEVILVILE